MVRQMNQNVKAGLKEHVDLITVCKGIGISYLITLPAFAIFAIILTYADFPDKLVSPVVVVTTVISIMFAGSFSTRNLKNKGWFNGCIVGLVYMVVLYILSSMIFKDFTFDRYVATMFLIGAITGSIGGIVGINLKRNTRLRHR